MELTLKILGYFDSKELTFVRLLSRKFKLLGDREEFYSTEVFKLKEIFSALTAVRIEIDQYHFLLKNKVNKINELLDRNACVFGFTVSSIGCIFPTITNLFCEKLPSIKEELKIRGERLASIELIEKEIKNFDLMELEKQHGELNKAYLGQRTKVRQEYAQEELKRIKQEAFDQMMSLFGGRVGYEALPVLDIGDRQGFTGLIDFIKPEEMSAPIMRGKDKQGRNFFTIRFKDEKGKYNCQTFFERFTKVNSWFDAGDRLVKFEGYIIENGQIKTEALKELAAAIQAKQNGDKVIV